MTHKKTNKGRVLYPGVILHGDGMLIRENPAIPKVSVKRKAKAIRKNTMRTDIRGEKKIWNLLIDD